MPQRRGEPTPFRENVKGVFRHPSRTFADVALDKQWRQATGLLVGVLALDGLLVGATGQLDLPDGFSGAGLGLAIGVGAGAPIVLLLSLVFHRMARTLEGRGTLVGTYAALAFTSPPLLLVGLGSLLALTPVFGGLLFFLGFAAGVFWTVRLSWIAIQAAQRVPGLLAFLVLVTPLITAFLTGGVLLFFGGIVYLLVASSPS
ncbi:MAG: YIP1 family protein [Chloroflexi bacterium]|nr:YIP1 family protein [Chloroflexota bacterium]